MEVQEINDYYKENRILNRNADSERRTKKTQEKVRVKEDIKEEAEALVSH